MATFICKFVRFDNKREYSTRLTKQKFNKGNIETINKKKERFLMLISLLPIHTFRGIRIVPRKRDCCGQINISCHQHLESKGLSNSHPIFKPKYKKMEIRDILKKSYNLI